MLRFCWWEPGWSSREPLKVNLGSSIDPGRSFVSSPAPAGIPRPMLIPSFGSAWCRCWQRPAAALSPVMITGVVSQTSISRVTPEQALSNGTPDAGSSCRSRRALRYRRLEVTNAAGGRSVPPFSRRGAKGV